MKSFLLSCVLLLGACPLKAQLTAVPNSDFPTFRTNLNNSLANGVNRTIVYSNPSFVGTLDWSKLINTPALGLGTVTSVSIVGTASQISTSGTCTGTTVITCTLSLPSVLILPGTINKITLTQPATAATLTIANNKVLTVNNTVTFAGTDGSTITYGAGGTISYIGVAETFSGDKTFTGFLSAIGATRTAPVKTGTSVPGGCTIGDIFFNTTVSAGQNLYFCTSTGVYTQMSGAGGGGQSVFTGSIATSTTGITGTAAAPILALTDQSLKSPVCFEITLTASTPVTSVTINNKTSGAQFCIAWTQPASNMTTVSYGGSASNTCAVDGAASITTTQYLRIKSDGSTVIGIGCSTNNSGVEAGPTVAAPGTPPASTWVRWGDSTANVFKWKFNNSSTESFSVIQKSSRTANQFLTHIVDGVQTPAAIAAADVPAALSSTTSVNGTTIPASATLPKVISALASNINTIGTLAANTCTDLTIVASGVLSTDVIIANPNAAISGVTGWAANSTLSVRLYPTSGQIHLEVCNADQTNSVTPGVITLNTLVIR